MFPDNWDPIVPLCSTCVTQLFGEIVEARKIEQRRIDAEREARRIEGKKELKAYMKAKAKENRINFLKRKAQLESALQGAFSES
jgi:hypothetical protein